MLLFPSCFEWVGSRAMQRVVGQVAERGLQGTLRDTAHGRQEASVQWPADGLQLLFV